MPADRVRRLNLPNLQLMLEAKLYDANCRLSFGSCRPFVVRTFPDNLSLI
jgi:hypothetical protein